MNDKETNPALVRVEPERHLAILNQARAFLAEARTVEETLTFRDQIAAAEHYLKVHGHATEACNQAAEAKLRVERRLGELLAGMPKQRPGEYQRSHDVTVHPSLADLGIEKMQSHRWQAIATVPELAFEEHIREVKEAGEQLTTAGVLRLVKQRAKAERRQVVRSVAAESVVTLDGLVAEGRKFGTIYADPPWLYGNQLTRGATGDHYDGMTVEQLAELPVSALVADDAHLHLWTTNAFLEAAFGIVRAWGFEYRSLYVWCKPQMGMGNYWRVSTEYLLLGVRRSCSFAVHDLINYGVFDRGAHSAKPEQVRLLIEKASPGPYLELFGRKAVAGWTVFGNQVARDLFTQEEAAS